MSLYHTNMEIRREIDRVLHENAILFQNTGTDSTYDEKQMAVNTEKRNLREIRHLDSVFIDSLLNE